MYLRDYLHDIPLKALKAIASSLDVTVEYQARIKLINAIDRALWDGTLVENLLKKLSDDHCHLLSIIAFSYDAGIGEKALLKKVEKVIGINKQKVEKIIDDLLSFSLAGGINGDDNIYFCPLGVAEQVRKIFIRNLIDPYKESLPVPSASPPNLLEDIFSFLALVYKENIPLTLMGKIKKTFLDRTFIGSQTCVNHHMLFSENNRNTFIIKYLRERGLVSFDRHKVQPTEKLYGWLDLSMTERFQDIISFALSYILQDEFTIIALTGLMIESPAGSCFDTKKLAYFLHSNTMSHGGFSHLESKVRDILNISSQLGLFSYSDGRYVMTMTGEQFFQNKNISLEDNISSFFTIQPNFEIIFGYELDPRIRFKLELLSSRKNRDMVLTYIITQKGISRARERGMSTDEVINFFKEHSRNPVPQNVQFSIETWAKDYGSIYFEDSVLMRFRDANTCNSVAHLPEIAPYIKEQLSDRVLVISSEHIPTIAAVLKKSGYQPELYGVPTPGIGFSGEKYIHDSINSLLMKNKMPEIYNDFIFPEHLLLSEDTQ